MKIIVLGGAGDMGSRAVEDLAEQADVELLTIADYNEDAAQKVARKIQGKKVPVEVKKVDANNHNQVVEVMRGHDVAASAVGPFFRYEPKLVRAALEAGVHYASICDEWQPAEAIMEQFHSQAEERGLFIISGLGASPGLSNVGIRHLADNNDRTRRADIYVYQPLNAGGGEAVIRHMLHIISGQIAVWRGGKRIVVPACSESRLVEFPRYGRIRLWNMGHSEPVTIHRCIQGIEEVNFFMGFHRGARLFITPAQLGFFNNPKVVTAFVRLLLSIDKLTAGSEPGWGAIRLDVWGEKDGEETHEILCGVGQMRETTGVSLSIGVQMLGRNEVTTEKGGVYFPEACFDPQKFLSYLKEKEVDIYRDVGMTQPFI